MTIFILALSFPSHTACLEYAEAHHITAADYPCLELVQETGAPTVSLRPKARPE